MSSDRNSACERKKIPPPTLPKPKHNVCSPEEKVFFEKRKLAMADRRHGKDRPVSKLARDYEYEMEAIKARERPTLASQKKKKPMGGVVGAVVERYELLRHNKEEIRQRAEQKKLALAAERDADIAEIEANVAKREKELHEEKQGHLTDKMEKVVEEELKAKLSTLAEKKENIVEEEFKESVKEVEAQAEMEEKEADGEANKHKWHYNPLYVPPPPKIVDLKPAAVRRKWYDNKNPVPESLIYTTKNVQEKTDDMNALLSDLKKSVDQSKKRCG